MSDLILPPGISMPKPIRATEKPDEKATAEERAKQLPEPVGYKLLCILPDVEETFEGTNIVKADSFMKGEEHGTTVLFVLKVGPEAYKDATKFPNGAWCKAGDFVVVRTYSGTRIKMFGKELRLINDDQVEAVVADPRGISRAAA
jgi:co-chaperonin GroES (HSP10)